MLSILLQNQKKKTTMSKFKSPLGIARLFDEMFEVYHPFTSPFKLETYTLGGLYDPEKYELVERSDYGDKRAKEIQEDIDTLERNMKSTVKHYEDRIATLKGEKERLLGSKKKV